MVPTTAAWRAGLIGALLVGSVLVFSYQPAEDLAWDAREYADTAQHVVRGDGFVTTSFNAQEDHATARPGLYPPGLPLLLAPFAAAGDVQMGARFLSLAYLLTSVWAAWRLAGQIAATVTALCVTASPFLYQSAGTVMSDATGAMLGLSALALLARPERRSCLLAGFVMGLSVLVRLSSAPMAIAAILAAPPGQRRFVVLGTAPAAIALGTFQWHYFGSPFASGYGANNIGWSPASVFRPEHGDYLLQLGSWPAPFSAQAGWLPGLLYWPAALGVWWAFGPPVVGLLGLLPAWRARHAAAGRFALMTSCGLLLLCLPYFYQASRMLAPAAAMLIVFFGVGVARAVEQAMLRGHPSPDGSAARSTWTPGARVT